MRGRTAIQLSVVSLLCLHLIASSGFAWQAEDELLAILQSKESSFYDKTLACKQLATVGTEAAVPVLAKLLHDDKLSHYARYGLEPISSPKVDEAFLEALANLNGRKLVGVINSLANRGKASAIGPLSDRLADPDREVAIEPGMRIAQGVLARVDEIAWQEVDRLEESRRGAGGFGSTGTGSQEEGG